jgi:single-strand DNA-binding protein
MTNTIIISGNLGKNAELRVTQGGMNVLNFSLANTTGWGDKEKTNWFRCALFGDRAAKLAEHFTKGTKLLVIGELTFSEWEKDGVKRSSAEVFVKNFEFMGGKQEASHDGGGQANNTPAPDGDIDDEIPF